MVAILEVAPTETREGDMNFEEIDKRIPTDWIVQYGTSDIPQSVLTEPLIRCTLEELKSFLHQIVTEVVEAELDHLIYVFEQIEPNADRQRILEYIQKRAEEAHD